MGALVLIMYFVLNNHCALIECLLATWLHRSQVDSSMRRRCLRDCMPVRPAIIEFLPRTRYLNYNQITSISSIVFANNRKLHTLLVLIRCCCEWSCANLLLAGCWTRTAFQPCSHRSLCSLLFFITCNPCHGIDTSHSIYDAPGICGSTESRCCPWTWRHTRHYCILCSSRNVLNILIERCMRRSLDGNMITSVPGNLLKGQTYMSSL